MAENRGLEDRKEEAIRATLFPFRLLATKQLNCEQRPGALGEGLERGLLRPWEKVAEHYS